MLELLFSFQSLFIFNPCSGYRYEVRELSIWSVIASPPPIDCVCRDYERAIAYYSRALEFKGPKSASVFAALGFAHHLKVAPLLASV